MLTIRSSAAALLLAACLAGSIDAQTPATPVCRRCPTTCRSPVTCCSPCAPCCRDVGPVRRFLRRVFRPCTPPPRPCCPPRPVCGPVVVAPRPGGVFVPPPASVQPPLPSAPVPADVPPPPPGAGTSRRFDPAPVPQIRADRIASNSSGLAGQVMQVGNKPVPGARVTLVSASKATNSHTLAADNQGRFGVKVTPGTYHLYLRDASGKQVYQGKVLVAANATRKVTLIGE